MTGKRLAATVPIARITVRDAAQWPAGLRCVEIAGAGIFPPRDSARTSRGATGTAAFCSATSEVRSPKDQNLLHSGVAKALVASQLAKPSSVVGPTPAYTKGAPCGIVASMVRWSAPQESFIVKMCGRPASVPSKIIVASMCSSGEDPSRVYP